MTITEFLNSRGWHTFEGHSQQVVPQVRDLISLTQSANINVMEIGFNAGHSAEVFLQNNPSLTLTSFDIGSHDYVAAAKEYIDKTYPSRHTLILGDSTITIPDYIRNNRKCFDVIFIDGGHDYEIAKADIANCFHLAHRETVVAIDDVIFVNNWEHPCTIGPTKAWTENLQQNKIIEINRKQYCEGRGMVWGRYVI